jgi:hypothetical protein
MQSTLPCLAVSLVLLASLVSTRLVAQVTPTGSLLSGRLTDSTTGQHIRRANVCYLTGAGPAAAPTHQIQRCVMADTGGWFQLDTVPSGTLTVIATCDIGRGDLA